ncbi:MAG: hypothetical protein KGJ90_00420 [Patescibacteria group bacterium]|nr:hypothetical protein [Patescibacteria group bacterium]
MSKLKYVIASEILMIGTAYATCPAGNTGPCEAWSTFVGGQTDIGSMADGTKFGVIPSSGVTDFGTALEIQGYLLTKNNAWAGVNSFVNSDLRLYGSSTGYTTFANANSGATNFTLTFPALTDTLDTLTAAVTLSNKTLLSPTVSGGVLAGTFTGNFTYSGVPTFTGLSAGTAVSYLALDGSNHVVTASGTGGAGSGTVNPGTSGNVAYYAITGTAVSGEALSALIDSAIGSTQGNVLYRGAATWSVLAPGVSGQFLETLGTAANPTWGSPSGTGTVNAGTLGQVAFYASTGTAVSGEALSALLDSSIGSGQGDILYRGASNWSVLVPGTSGTFLESAGAAANPGWGTPTGALPGGATYTVQYNAGSQTFSGVALSANHVLIGQASGAPVDSSLSALMDAALGSTQGSVLYRGASVWASLTPGASGTFLESAGAAANPGWATPSGTGTVSLCSTATDIAYYAVSGSTVSCPAVTNSTLLGFNSSGVFTEITLSGGLTFSGASGQILGTSVTDTYHSGSATAGNIGGQDDFGGAGTATLQSGLGNGQTLFVTNQAGGALTISTSGYTVSGLPLPTTLHNYGFYGFVYNSTTGALNAFGNPGFGTITPNSLALYLDGTGATGASSVIDSGSGVTIAAVGSTLTPQGSGSLVVGGLFNYSGPVVASVSGTSCTVTYSGAPGCSNVTTGNGDCGQFISFTSASGITVTLPVGPLNHCQIAFEQDGAGTITLSGAAGLSLHKPNSFVGTSSGQYSTIGVTYVSSGVAIMTGNGA